MAKQQGGTSRTTGREQQAGQTGQTGQAGQAGQAGQSLQAQGAAGAAGGTGSQSTGSRADQERQRQVIREGGADAMTGTGGRAMQRGGAGQWGAGSALSGREQGQGQPMLLPAFMANPGLMASAFMTNPFAFTQAMSQEMDRLFFSLGSEDVGSQYGQQAGSGTGRGLMTSGAQQGGRGLAPFTPQIEVCQRGDDLVILVDLPGVAADEVDIVIENGVLTLSGARQSSSESRERDVYRTERSYGSFSRSIALPEGVDEDQVQASFDNGVLEIVVAVPEQRSRGRRVPIQAGARQTSSGQRQVGQGVGQSGATTGSQTRATSGSQTGATSGSPSGARTSAGQSAGRREAGGASQSSL